MSLQLPDPPLARVLFVASIVGAILSLIVVCLRVTACVRGLKILFEDWIMLSGLIMLTLGSIGVLLAVSYGGVGYAEAEINPNKAEFLRSLLQGLDPWYIGSLSVMRLFFCFFYMRSFMLELDHSFIKLIFIFIVIQALVAVFNNPFSVGPSVGSPGFPSIVAGLVGISIDLALMIFPVRKIAGSPTSRKTKACLTASLICGFLIIVIAVLRVQAVISVDETDITGTIALPLLYSLLQPLLTIMLACAAQILHWRECVSQGVETHDVELHELHDIETDGPEQHHIEPFWVSRSNTLTDVGSMEEPESDNASLGGTTLADTDNGYRLDEVDETTIGIAL